MRPLILAHGGAGHRTVSKVQCVCLADALVAGRALLLQGSSALAAVEETIRVLEASGLFNAGVGSRLQLDGVRRMDASIMEGSTLRAGAVAAIEGIRHPISAARLVMEQTEHVLLVAGAATRFARHFKLQRQHRADLALSRGTGHPRGRRRAWHTLRLYENMKRGMRVRQDRERRETVGAVALDRAGRLAAGASTGGIGFMLPGRVGDSPLIGSGVYADDESGAVSMTGLGESIMRLAVAKEITDRLAAGASPAQTARVVLRRLAHRVQGEAGALVLAPDGRFVIRHSTARMAAGYCKGDGKPVVGGKFT